MATTIQNSAAGKSTAHMTHAQDRKVRFVDYPRQFRDMEAEIMGTVHAILSKGDLMLRQQLRDFEAHLAEFCGTKYAVGTSNCTDALHLCLRAAGIGAGDEVISVSHTFVASIAAIHHSGATPVLVDIGEDHNIDPDAIVPAITKRTKAIMPVHLNGRVSEMDRIMAIAEKHGLVVIEDTAQALGGSLDGRRGGNWGLAGCFSFYPAKLLGAFGDAGALVTNSEEIATKVRSLRDHGRTPHGELSGWSFNCRLDNLQAALLDLKLPRVESWITRRRELAAIYDQELRDVEELLLPPAPDTGRHFDAFQNYEIEAARRDELVAHLDRAGIEILLPWGGRGVHQHTALGLRHFSLPRTERLFEGALLLPMFPELTDEQVRYVSQQIRAFYRGS